MLSCSSGAWCATFTIVSIVIAFRSARRKEAQIFAILLLALCFKLIFVAVEMYDCDDMIGECIQSLSYGVDYTLAIYSVLVSKLYASTETTPVVTNSMLRYQHTDQKWLCGSNDLQHHILGASTSFFFPNTSVDAINSCCHLHDVDYCCQVGRELADQKLYSCLRIHCMESYCDKVVDMYTLLLDNLGESAYYSSSNREGITCEHINIK